mgnify:FL=1|jgi:hypothetical protein
MSENVSGKFELLKKTSFRDLVEGEKVELPESDLAIQNEEFLLQFRYIRPEEDKKYEVKPGTYRLTETSAGIQCAKYDMVNEPLLETIDNTSRIITEARKFFNRLHVYEKRKRTKKRGVLLFSKPGMGKTQSIKKFCRDFVKEDAGTVVFVWPTSEIEADSISRFLSITSEFTKECTRLILVIEDIGGGEREGGPSRNGVDSGLLELLDGQGVSFRLPTFIIATTNHPENLLESLADRPGRFDLMLELQPPKYEERVALVEFIADRPLTDEEKAALKRKEVDNFSIAHLSEIVIRADLDDKTYPEVIEELIAHSQRFKRSFEEERNMGFGLGR